MLVAKDAFFQQSYSHSFYYVHYSGIVAKEIKRPENFEEVKLSINIIYQNKKKATHLYANVCVC